MTRRIVRRARAQPSWPFPFKGQGQGLVNVCILAGAYTAGPPTQRLDGTPGFKRPGSHVKISHHAEQTASVHRTSAVAQLPATARLLVRTESESSSERKGQRLIF